jgi:pimeloyl-ACP methyl ester carboxylesterase
MNLSNLIVRPPRTTYDIRSLPEEYIDGNRVIKREDVCIMNSREQRIFGSYMPASSFAPGNPCIIYLHGNASSQLEGIFVAKLVYGIGISVLTIDCNGSGISDGEYISLGYHEREDVKAAVKYLREHRNVQSIVLWGRSMGATLAAWCAADPELELSGIICDSPYISVDAVIEDMVGDSIFLWLLSKALIPLTNITVKYKIGVSMHSINLMEDVKKARVPLLIIHAFSDSFIKVRQSRELFAAYGCAKKYMYTPKGDHSSPRQPYVISQELYFIFDCFDLDIDIESLEDIDDGSCNHFTNAVAMSANMQVF